MEATSLTAGSPVEDREVIQRIRSGEKETYADLVRRYQAKVLRLCTSLLADATLAEDAAQEIFLKAYQGLDTFRGEALFSTWLYRIAANHCKDLLRKRIREKTESWETLVEEQGEQLQQLLTSPENPTSSLANTELVERVLSHLAPDYRLILTLREVQGLSYRELAEALGCSVDAVKARLRRARQDLQEKLRHFFGPGNV